MAVCRVEKNKNYTTMSNYHLRDPNLSNKARGLLSTMLSLPESWDYTTRGLAKICKDGVDGITAQLRELEQCGYLIRNRIRDSSGRIVDMEYIHLRATTYGFTRYGKAGYGKTEYGFTTSGNSRTNKYR